MPLTRSAGPTSLSRYPAAPARMAGRTLSSSRKLVSAITRVPGCSAAMRRVASTPSMPGMTRSMSTTSGRSAATAATAAAPSATSPTTSTSSCRPRNVRSPWRTTAWSSAIRTRIAVTRHLQGDGRARAGARGDVEAAAERGGPLLHRGQPERAGPPGRVIGVEAHAVVVHPQGQGLVVLAQSDLEAAGAGVAQGVVQRLLGDAEDLLVDPRTD